MARIVLYPGDPHQESPLYRTLSLLTCLVLGFAVAGSAGATTHQYLCSPAAPGVACTTGNHAAGNLTSIDARYDDVAEHFSWDARFSPSSGVLPTSGWLVVSPGPNPKDHVDEYAILYLDGQNAKVTAYVYNGVNSSNSWTDPAGYLGSFGMNVVDHANGDRSFRISMDVAGINAARSNPEWTGVAFGPSLGFWFHPSLQTAANAAGPDFRYSNDGRIDSFDYDSQGWYDKRDLATNPIPEPSAALVFGIGALLVHSTRRRA